MTAVTTAPDTNNATGSAGLGPSQIVTGSHSTGFSAPDCASAFPAHGFVLSAEVRDESEEDFVDLFGCVGAICPCFAGAQSGSTAEAKEQQHSASAIKTSRVASRELVATNFIRSPDCIDTDERGSGSLKRRNRLNFRPNLGTLNARPLAQRRYLPAWRQRVGVAPFSCGCSRPQLRPSFPPAFCD
jgi:hypothetical protein